MLFYVLFDIVCVSLVATIIFTQIIVPIWNRTKLFPFLRKERNQIDDEIVKISEKIEVAELQKELKQLEKKLKSTK